MKKLKRYDVLLTYGWVRSTYAALRNLENHGISVAVSDTSRFGMCQQSRLKQGQFIYSNPYKEGDKKFIDDIYNIVNRNDISVLIPSHDETEILAKYREVFKNMGTIIPVHEYKYISFANNKLETVKLAHSLGLSVPQMLKYSDLIFVENASTQYVIKLLKGNSAKGVFYAANVLEAQRLFKKVCQEFDLSENRLPIIQEKVSGDGWGVSCLYWKGERIAYFTHKRLREKTSTGGTSTLRQAVSNPFLEEMAFLILDHLKWHGLAMVEFKYDDRIKKGWFIEINPRMWGSIHLAIDSGVEFPYLLYLCAKGREDEAKYLFRNAIIKTGNIARWYLGDLIILSQKVLNFEFANIAQYLKKGKEDSYDDLFLDDSLAFIGEVLNYGIKFFRFRSSNPVEDGTIG